MSDFWELSADRLRNGNTDSKQTPKDDVYTELRQQIYRHRQYDDQSIMGTVVDGAYNKVYGSNKNLEILEGYERQYRVYAQTNNQAELTKLREDVRQILDRDKTDMSSREQVMGHSTGFMKTVGLFMRNRLGGAVTMGTFALDEARPSDSYPVMAADLTLGAFKGYATKKAFHSIMSMEGNIAIKGAGMGLSARLIDQGLNRRNFMDSISGKPDVLGGLGRIKDEALRKEALVADATVFTAAYGLFGSANYLSRGVLGRSPMLSTTLTGTSFGLSSGAYEEIDRQAKAGEDLDISGVLKHSLLRGGLDTIAAMPGGYQARLATRVGSQRGERLPEFKILEPVRAPETPVAEKAPELERLDLRGRRTSGLDQLTKQLGKPTTLTELVRRPAPGKENLADEPLIRVPEEMNSYRAEGAPEILIPKVYEAQLAEVRALRQKAEAKVDWSNPEQVRARQEAKQELEKHPLKDRLLPEDLLPHLAELPGHPTRRVLISDRPNPGDPEYRVKLNDPNFKSGAEATSNGDIWLFEPTRSILDNGPRSPLSKILKHEYGHQVRWSQPELSTLYDLAGKIEVDGKIRDYGKTSGEESWAINLGENLLHADPAIAKTTAEQVPLRTLIISRSLLSVLREAPLETRSPHHERFVRRALQLETIATPLAQKALDAASQPGSSTLGEATTLKKGLGLR